MSVTTMPSRTPAAANRRPHLEVTQLRVLRSEFTKFRSLRSTVYTLATAVLIMIGIGAVFSAVVASHYQGMSAEERFRFSPIGTSLGGTIFAVVAFGVLGVLMTSGEYGTGMIRSSLTVVPRRLPVLWGKLIVFAGAVFPVSLVAAFVSFFVGQAILNGHDVGVSITEPTALRSVIGAALYVTVAGLLGAALGGVLRNTAAAVATFTGVFFVLQVLIEILPSSVGDQVGRFLPNHAGEAVWSGANDVTNALGPWTGFAVMCGYAAAVVAAAAWRLRRSDA